MHLWNPVQGAFLKVVQRPVPLSQRFALASFAILIGGMVVVGWWVSQRIREAIFRQATEVTSAYVESFVSPYIADYVQNGYVSPGMAWRFSQELSAADFGHPVLLLKVWDENGHILYSNLPLLIGRSYPLNEHLEEAFDGEIVAYQSDLSGDDHALERLYWDSVIEIYTPVYAPGTRQIIAVAEYYLPGDALSAEIRSAQLQSWGIVFVATLLIYVLLNSLVRHADQILQQQAAQLTNQVQTLEQLLAQNHALHQRVQRAARRTIELNERFLRRISAELHDGPLQMLGAVALRLDNLSVQADAAELQQIQQYLQEAMQEMRALAAGLRLPDMEALPLFNVLERVITRHEQRTQTTVHLDVGELPPEDRLSTELKIAVYRIVEEALNNAHKHAPGSRVYVSLQMEAGQLHLLIRDDGPGFSQSVSSAAEPHLGLLGMRERAESLGGVFHISGQPGQGVQVQVTLPLATVEAADDEKKHSNRSG